jgi:predicted Rossmann fold flavoprotein
MPDPVRQFDTAIIGAGAAGLTAAIFAAQGGAPRVALVESAKQIGAKILVAGGGRCNVTHHQVTPEDYFGNRNIVKNVLRAFDVERTITWFASLGVELKREPTGKLFPVTDKAQTVRDALVNRARELGVTIITEHRVKAVRRTDASFDIDTDHGPIACQTLALATGGRSLPRTGSDGHGWNIARRLGHSVTDTHAALVPLMLDDSFFHAGLSGISHQVQVITSVDRKVIDRRTGSMLWTHVGVSGPVVMDASRFWSIAHDQGQTARVKLNLLPTMPPAEVERWLKPDAGGLSPRQDVGGRILEHLPQRVVEALCHRADVSAGTPINELKRDDRRALVRVLTELELPVIKHRGWNYAEVTAGGVPLNEIDHRTMASRKVDGLYLVGEILDNDGRIGGFNFQWAWATGHLAGSAIAKARAR